MAIVKLKRQAQGSVKDGTGIHASFWMPRELHSEVKEAAHGRGVSFAVFVVQLIQDGMRTLGRRKSA